MAAPEDRFAKCVLSIAAALAAAGSGDKAEARRMDSAGSAVFWLQAARLGLPKSEEPIWLAYTRMVALLTPASVTSSVHDPKQALGAVLYQSGVSEQRLARLLASRGPARLEAVERLIRAISRARPPMDLVSLARAAFGREGNALARSYYRSFDQALMDEARND